MSFKKSYEKYNLNKYEKTYFSGTKKSYRVKSPVKSFRDLDVYKNTTLLSSEIYKFKIPKKFNIEDEIKILKNLSKNVPRFIAESYGDKFSDRKLALYKLEKSMQYISGIVAKMDFLIAILDEDTFQKQKEDLLVLIKKYQTQKIKILNLKKAWQKVF